MLLLIAALAAGPSVVDSLYGAGGLTPTDDPLACLLREGGAPGCLSEVLLESMGSLQHRLARRNPVLAAAPVTFVGPPFSPTEKRTAAFMRPALGPLGTSVLPYLEAHFSQLPLKSGLDYPHLPHSHFDEELIIVVKGTARFFFSERDTEQVVRADQRRGKNYRPQKPSARLLHYDAPRGTIVLHPAQNNHTISSVAGQPVEYICIRLVRARTLSELLSQRHAGLVPGQINRTRVLTPSAETLAAWHDGGGGSGAAAAPAAARKAAAVGLRRGGTRKEVLFEEPVEAGEEQLEVHATVTNPGGGYGQHTDAHDVVLLVLNGRVRLLPSEQVLGPGSVALLPAGSKHGLVNVGAVPSVHYAFEFRKGCVNATGHTINSARAARRKRAGARGPAAAIARGGQAGPPTAEAAAPGSITVRRRMKTTRLHSSPHKPRDVNKAGALSIVGICVLQWCNATRLADWVRLLRAPGHGAWDGGVAVVIDRKNARAAAALRLNASLVPPPLSWKSGWASLVRANQASLLGRGVKPTALAGQQHMHAAVLKTHLLGMEQLRGFDTLVYVDVDCAAVSSVRATLEAPRGALDAVVDLGMPADTKDARSSAVIVMRRTRGSRACVRAWREQIARNLDEFSQQNGSVGLRCGRRVYTSSSRISGHPCFKDQQALNQVLQGSACGGSVALIPQLVLQWTAALERGQLPLQQLLDKPSSRKGVLCSMHADADARNRCTALSIAVLEVPCFVHFSRWERDSLAVYDAGVAKRDILWSDMTSTS